MQETYHYGDVLLIKKFNNTYATNDIVYIEVPVKDPAKPGTYFFQRLVGLPGDSIEIKDKVVYINGMAIQDTITTKHNYHVKSVSLLDSMSLVKQGLTEGVAISEKNDYSFALNKFLADSLKRLPVIEKVEPEVETKGNSDLSCFPYSINYKWNLDHYGKLYIPKKNDTLKLDSVNIVFYKKLIEEYEKNTLEIKNDSIFINNDFCVKYCVKKNYYFTLGDNRDNANDSRKLGFFPEDFIAGKSVWLIKRAKK